MQVTIKKYLEKTERTESWLARRMGKTPGTLNEWRKAYPKAEVVYDSVTQEPTKVVYPLEEKVYWERSVNR